MSVNSSPFFGLIDLASAALGSQVVEANDDFFAEKENLIKPEDAVFLAEKFTDRGKWMDGWESRRKRGAKTYDWCVISLGLAGDIKVFDVDTSYFVGNSPAYAALEGNQTLDDKGWQPLVLPSPLRPGGHNFFMAQTLPFAPRHLRLRIYPDGGVARLRAYGTVYTDPQALAHPTFDAVALANGGRVLAASDSFFAPMHNLILPGDSSVMNQGWETRRRRDEGHDWTIVKTATPCLVHKITLATTHFKGNFPDQASVDGCSSAHDDVVALQREGEWFPIMPKTTLRAHATHEFSLTPSERRPVTHVRLNIFPDGGIARMRILAERTK